MSRYAPPIAVPAEASDLVDRIVSGEDAFWTGLRAFNRSDHKTGAQIDALMRSSDQRDEWIEELRRRFFPRAHRLIVDRRGVYTVSPTARSVRMVWSIPKPAEPWYLEEPIHPDDDADE
ncbi:beta/alpha barrel domain-containing protein [Microbacterium xylanilyticum]